MELNLLRPKKSLNKAFLKEKVSRDNIEGFKKNLRTLLNKINEKESEEHLKNLVSDFLKDTWYKEIHEINTKGNNDLVIHTGKTTKESVGVILEVKRPTNKSEMIWEGKPNSKALHELILYYLRERIEHDNIDIKYLIVTNINEWYIFDEIWFENNVYRSSKLRKDFESWKLSGKDTKFFYDSIAKPFLDTIGGKIDCTYFDIRSYIEILSDDNSNNDGKLIELYKVLSPTHLLKQPFANDSNSLDRKFYTELLHIIGLEEKKDGGKKLINRKVNSSPASIIENVIIKLEDKDCLRNIPNIDSFGKTRPEQLFGIGMELTITWINRILFLKLLEAQLFNYHKNNSDYLFLKYDFVFDYDELNNLFFQILAEKPSKRREHLKLKYSKVPYLNSSLFERTELERQTIDISSLENRLELEILKSTVLKDEKGKNKVGKLQTLRYLFEFLESYDFTSEGSEEIQEENKNLINASVLGLIFEKINGYKDGSFFTPGFITMYISRETIRKAVINKFNEKYNIDCDNWNDLKNFITPKYKASDILEFNALINQLKICDPAVGSGHFLVSALNELIAIKADLGLLSDYEGVRLIGYEVKVENDELILTYNDNTEIFEYKVFNGLVNKEAQRVQKTLFHEKETIIEKCLFGVDINPNSVKICRLRLWIELLKSAYYTEESRFLELETLPNIDINIKCGSSLINRFKLDADISGALKGKSIADYEITFEAYHHAKTKEEKREIESLLKTIKNDYTSVIYNSDPRLKRLSGLKGQKVLIENKVQIGSLFEKLKAKDIEVKVHKIQKSIDELEHEIDEIKNNQIYSQSFEWRIEFPQILSKQGEYIGFDVIIGNPPYIFGGNEGIPQIEKKYYKNNYISGSGKINLFTLFIERAFNLLKENGQFAYIIPNTFLRVTSYHDSRKLLIDNNKINTIYDFGDSVFEDAITTAIVIIGEKSKPSPEHNIEILSGQKSNSLVQQSLKDLNYVIATNIDNAKKKTIDKLLRNTLPLGSICKELIFGVVITKNKNEVVSNIPIEGWKPFLEGKDIGSYFIKPIHSYLNYKPALLHRARTKEIFESPEKLIIQRITGGSRPLKVAYDDRQYYNKESINNIILIENSNFSYKYILCLLNSKLINWFYANQFTNESRLTVNLSKEYLSQIPISPATLNEQAAFIKIVDYILFLYEWGIDRPINNFVPNKHIIGQFEEILDAMVFELYFKDDFAEVGIHFIEFITKEFSTIDKSSDKFSVEIIHEAYQSLRQKDNIIRNNLKLMDIRIGELIMPIKRIV